MTESINKNLRVSKFDDHYIIGNNGTYFKVGLVEGSVIEKLVNGLTPERIAEEINQDLNVVEQVISALKENCVITEGKQKKRRFNPFYIRIPLFDANKLLDFILKRFFGNRIVNHIIIALLMSMVIGGIVLSAIRSRVLFSFESVIDTPAVYVVVYVAQFLTIILHEMAHGLTCNYFGGRAGKIGVALIAFNPAMYCEISSIREFKERYKKVICCSAGLTINASSLFLLNVADIIYPMNFFKMMIIINIGNIIFNILPFIRLDGYWIFSFATGIDNLYSKSLRKVFNYREWFKDRSKESIILMLYGTITTVLLLVGLYGFTSKMVSLLIRAYHWIMV
ncbi:hypothetical protein [Butyrivibrio sp. YAB3001]|uniref:hypothetical protein n=1 Tax=Butyrivibrio sp. YAB3001 TaxID=1520812 RepID=UPI0008F63142|nr:hypothetical protein [Butyrivibrio sp. YAB3001]SFC11187.1 putative peptide zinc metalloprotease protein [Butyrivibrio sp. YAB3001]